MNLHGMIRAGIISHVNGAVSAGKESVLFWAGGPGGSSIALKIYLVTTSNFKRRSAYILGDPRFARVRRGTRNVVNLWARKEFANLGRCLKAGIPVPRPIHVSRNVLAMEFVGEGGAPAATLSASEADIKDYEEAIRIIIQMYKNAGLVHCDLSPYNIFKTPGGLIVFDLGSAVDTRHPHSAEFLKRDIHNITNFFVQRGLVVENPLDILGKVAG